MSRISLFALALLINIGVFAQNVAVEEAKKIAENYLLMHRDNAGKTALTVSEHYTKNNDAGEVLYYIINFKEGGFVIVSGDKRVYPILAFSTTNTFLADENHPSCVFLESYKAGIEHIKAVESPTNISPKWNEIAAKKQHKSIIKEVGPLVTCKWNQDKYYNTLCPDDNRTSGVAGTPGYDYHVPNGCVAVAMAQILYYHRFPRKGKGSSSYNAPGYGKLSVNHAATTYDYESMADVASGYSDAIARLIYHLGVSVNMGYGTDGSGTASQLVPSALASKFCYKSMRFIEIEGDHVAENTQWWKDTLRQNIDRNLPVYYAACRHGHARDGCHAFVCDGYILDNDPAVEDKFHFNFGWGGYNDGFYTLSTMQDFYLRNEIIVGIEPADIDTANFFTGRKTLTATYGSFEDGSGRFDYRPNTNCEWLISPQNGRNITSITLTVGTLSLASGDTVKIYRGDKDSLIAIITDTAMMQGTYVVNNTSEVLVVFTSDISSGGEDGFIFNYTSTKTSSNYCPAANNPTRITTKTGSIESGSGTGVYDSDNTCYWAIAPAGTTDKISFVFSKFDLAQGDILEVIAHPTDGGSILPGHWNTFYSRKLEDGALRFSLDNQPNLNTVYTVPIQLGKNQTAGTLLFRFRTDNKDNGTGFRIYWDSVRTNIQEYNLGLAKLSVYPNPVNDAITVDLYTDKEENIQIDLCDVVGKKLYSASKQQIIGEYQERISVGNYAKGLYMLRISTSKGTVIKKIVVDK